MTDGLSSRPLKLTYCADRSRLASESVWGTPPGQPGWILFVDNAPWPADISERLPEICPEYADLRPLLIRGHNLPHGSCAVARDGKVHWFNAAREAEPGLQQTFQSFLLVCTHASHDLCCGRFGSRLVRDLRSRGILVLECSHLGGDRFAANGIALPHGALLGRLDTSPADDIAASLRTNNIPPGSLRGWPGQSAQEAVVEAAVRERLRNWDMAVRPEIEINLDSADDVQTFVCWVGPFSIHGRLKFAGMHTDRFTCNATSEASRRLYHADVDLIEIL